jgi:hypothetical protein
MDNANARTTYCASGSFFCLWSADRITAHIPHHVRFIEEKRRAMA